jgi:hypothetical protein
LKGFG